MSRYRAVAMTGAATARIVDRWGAGRQPDQWIRGHGRGRGTARHNGAIRLRYGQHPYLSRRPHGGGHPRSVVPARDGDPSAPAARWASSPPKENLTIASTITSVPSFKGDIVAKLYDLVLTNGSVVDGSGLPAYRADIGVRDGLIQKVGTIDPEEGRRDRRRPGPDGGTRVHRPPYPPRSPALLGSARLPVGVPRSHHGDDRQLQRDPRPVPPRGPRCPLPPLLPPWRRSRWPPFSRASTGGWETFGQFLDLLRRPPGHQHGRPRRATPALRYYVMGAVPHTTGSPPRAEIDGPCARCCGRAPGAAPSDSPRPGCSSTWAKGGRPIPSRLASDHRADRGLATRCSPNSVWACSRPTAATSPSGLSRSRPRPGRTHRPRAHRPGGPARQHRLSVENPPRMSGRRCTTGSGDGLAAGPRGCGSTPRSHPCRLDLNVHPEGHRGLRGPPDLALGSWRCPANERTIKAFGDPAIRDAMQFEAVDDTVALLLLPQMGDG